MKTKLTKRDKAAYIAKPSLCPYCESSDITSDGLEADGNTAWTTVVCERCGRQWTDIFTLTGIKETN